MREHPIPQDITGYQFHIIGSMTLKQFAEVAIGVVIGVIIYSTNLPAPIKWPLIFIFVGIGAAAAFLPVAERPLDHWIITFFRKMYQPTKFFWKRSPHVPDAFNFQQGKIVEQDTGPDLSPARRQRIKEYLESVDNSQPLNQLDALEQQQINQIMGVFDQVNPVDIEVDKQATKPDLKVKVRSLQKPDSETKVVEQKSQHQVDAESVATELEIPQSQPVEGSTEEEVVEVTVGSETPSQQQGVYVQDQQNDSVVEDFQDATFNDALPFPSKPDKPNKLVGMILTPQNELIPDAIIEIKDEQNRVVRAVKTNALGQFFITTPLKKGTFTIHTEHDNYQFNDLDITLNNEIVEPIEIRSLS